MGFLKHFRSRSKLNQQPPAPAYPPSPPYSSASVGNSSSKPPPRLPHRVLETLFSYICPHVEDQTYEVSERSMIGDGCPLCDLRDLANCAQVCREWYAVAQRLLYGSVRIDAVHYCELEEILCEKRRQRSRKQSNSADPPALRLQLFTRTVRESRQLAQVVHLLKLPYMTRESCKVELARAVSVLPNLLYVDLPEGFFTNDPLCLALRQELQASCPEIRKMKYESGSEQALELLANGLWPNIEVLELAHLAIEPGALRMVLASLTALRELKIADIASLDDSVFHTSPALPPFPALQKLSLARIPRITHTGLIEYISNPQDPFIRDTLTNLSLIHMPSISTANLHAILSSAPRLTTLTFESNVSRSLPLEPIPPLSSRTLQTIYFELTSDTSPPQHSLLKDPTESHYAYLTSSLHANALPSLRKLYVRSPTFADSLLLAPPIRPFATHETSNNPRHSNSNPFLSSPSAAPAGFSHPLEVYSKGLDELDWVYTSVAPPSAPGRPSSRSGDRPLSSFTAQLGPQWGGDARKSVVVGNGFGGFLAVPLDEAGGAAGIAGAGAGVGGGGGAGRPSSSGGYGANRMSSVSSGSGGSGGSGGGLLSPPAVFGHRPRTGSLGRFNLPGFGGGEGVKEKLDKRATRADLWR
ncbi:hypothetical protein EV356DRAFT_473666 [Viridothelium virens]|uniref:Uncharacterized protein n=1 Tax=Viridothelium virens TaxID=1048519 RepID=A0A6A6GY63_VIRVR|nr:hypothetical protein EV356DRAFT_473666 [Viridothelium virens]